MTSRFTARSFPAANDFARSIRFARPACCAGAAATSPRISAPPTSRVFALAHRRCLPDESPGRDTGGVPSFPFVTQGQILSPPVDATHMGAPRRRERSPAAISSWASYASPVCWLDRLWPPRKSSFGQPLLRQPVALARSGVGLPFHGDWKTRTRIRKRIFGELFLTQAPQRLKSPFFHPRARWPPALASAR